MSRSTSIRKKVHGIGSKVWHCSQSYSIGNLKKMTKMITASNGKDGLSSNPTNIFATFTKKDKLVSQLPINKI